MQQQKPLKIKYNHNKLKQKSFFSYMENVYIKGGSDLYFLILEMCQFQMGFDGNMLCASDSDS